MNAEHVAEVLCTICDLADEGDRGKATRARIAVAALASVDTTPTPTPNPELARSLLAAELGPWARDLLDEVTRLEGEGAALDADADGMFWLDLALVHVLARVDADDAAEAREARAKARGDDRWKLWADAETPLGLVGFAGVLWSRKVQDRWRRGLTRPPAIVWAFAEPLLRLGHGATFDEARGEVVDESGERIAGLKPGFDVATVDLEVMRRGLDVFRSTMAKRLIRFFAREAHAAEVRGDHRPEIVRVDGGFVGLAECIGADPGKDAEKLRDLLAIGRMLDVSTPGLQVHGLWHANTVRPNAPGQRRVLEVVLNYRVFLSGAAEAMKATGATTKPARRARLLVPVLQHDPPYRVAQRREWGRVWSVADAVLMRLVEDGAELAREGGVRVDSKAWARLVTDAGLDEGRAPIVRDLMLDGEGADGRPPLLRRTGADRFSLAPEHATELAFILARSGKGNR